MGIKQNRFKCKYLECNMDGCYCKLGLNLEGYGHCLIPYKQDSCDYYQEKENENKKLIREMASDMDYACTKHDLWPEDAKEIAKVLDTLGYKKIKEDEIVIKKSEYENLIKNKSRCHKCIYEMICTKDKDNSRQCPNYKKDSPDGGYYG